MAEFPVLKNSEEQEMDNVERKQARRVEMGNVVRT
jgi:hypothetical protein